MKYKVTLPVLFLLLVAGQMSAEFCMARCEGMSTRMLAHACGMHGMAQGQCAMCNHASASGTNSAASAPETCSDQICNSVLGLLQNRHDFGIEPSVAAIPLDVVIPPVLEGDSSVRFRTARSTQSIPRFDPLISSLRI